MRQYRLIIVFFSFWVLLHTAFAQSDSSYQYYSTINPVSPTFVTDLHNRINSHNVITYNNYQSTYVTNFASFDTSSGQRAVTCVYSGFNYVYSPPFDWTVLTREHTWCQSWMPSKNEVNFTSLPEYSDQHHLFPAHQANANSKRSNHPLGNVSIPSYQFLEAKLGTDLSGNIVFEPRAVHKGDAARALFYMALCYNSVNGHRWTFNYLNDTILPSLPQPEEAQNVDLLKQWHTQDPPDTWEKRRNDYVFSLQDNRNPFVDHPEWVELIDFKTLSWIPPVLNPAPANHIARIDTSTTTASSLRLIWTLPDAGSQSASGYLLLVSNTFSFPAPNDATEYSDDSTWTDGCAVKNLGASDTTCTITNLNPATRYHFWIYPYNGAGSHRHYKTDGTVPHNYGETKGVPPLPGKITIPVVVNEYFNGSSASTEWIELLVIKDSLDMRGMKIKDYTSGGSGRQPFIFKDVPLWSSVAKGTFIVVLAKGNTQNEEINTAARKIIVNAANSLYFDSTSAAFDIAGTADAIQLLKKDYSHIHILGHGDTNNTSNPWLRNLPLPKGIAYGTSTTNYVVRFFATDSSDDFNSSTKAQHYANATQGMPNDAVQQAFINQLVTDVEHDNPQSALPSALLPIQNFPNPFNPTTFIYFQLSSSSTVSLKIYDILGREIERLIEGELAPGIHNVQWNALGHCSGLYICRLHVRPMYGERDHEAVALHKLLLLK